MVSSDGRLGKRRVVIPLIDVDGPTGLQRSRRLPPRDRAPRAPARPTGTAPGPRQWVWRARGGGARRRGRASEGRGGRGSRAGRRAPAGAADGSCPTRGAAAGAPRRSARRATARTGPRAWVPGRRPRPTRSSAPPRQWSPGSRDEVLHRGGHLFGGDVRKTAMVAERAGRGARRGAGTAVERALQDGGPRAIREEAELPDGGSEQRDDWCPDARGHVHDAGIARHHDPRPGEQRARLLERKLAGGTRDRASPFG